ncbi:uncharacterized protein BDV17DRAFT_227780 [Aspergillus undulatus]|uniref:uncharacterized protein n=1 Tax=Aspergillus undulatus TaxID=1810928 RepID=UPI003CCE4FA1
MAVLLVLSCKARTCEFPLPVSFPSYGIAPRYAVLSSPPAGPCDYIRTVFAVLTLFSCQFLLFPLSPPIFCIHPVATRRLTNSEDARPLRPLFLCRKLRLRLLFLSPHTSRFSAPSA